MLLYQLNPDGMSYTVTGTDDSDTSIVIPREYNGYPVSGTAEYAFAMSNITDISFELPSNCTFLGGGCFLSIGNLQSIHIPNSVQIIGDGCFFGCGLLSTILFESGSACTTIGLNAFSSTNITSVTIPASVTTIAQYIIINCPNLQSIYFEGPPPSGGNILSDRTNVHGYVTDQYAASWFPYIGSGYRNIAMMSVSVQLDSTQSQYIVTGVSGEPPVLIIPPTYNGLPITEIAPNAFSSYTTPHTFRLDPSSNLTTIGASAFSPALSGTVILLNGLTTIGENAFNGCSHITAIVIPASIQTIGNDAFSNCPNLTSIYFLGEARPLPQNARLVYPQTTYAYYMREHSLSWLPYQYIGYGGLIFPSINGLQLEVVQNVDTTYCIVLGVNGEQSVLVIPPTYNGIPITEIANYAFSSYTTPHIILFEPSSNLTTIGAFAFSSALSGIIVLPATVHTIDIGAFSNSTLLEAIYFTGPAPAEQPGGEIVSPSQSKTVAGYYLREYYVSWIPYQQAGYRGLSFHFLFSSQSMFKLVSNPNSNRNGSANTAAKRASVYPSGAVGRNSRNTDMRLLAARRLVCPASCMTGIKIDTKK